MAQAKTTKTEAAAAAATYTVDQLAASKRYANRRDLIRHLAALRHSLFRVVDHVQGRGAEKARPYLAGIPGGGHNHVQVPRVQPLLYVPPVHLYGRKGGVERKAHAVIDTAKTDFRH